MKTPSGWHYRPFAKYNEPDKAHLPYICGIFPSRSSFTFEWFDNGDPGEHILSYGEKDNGGEERSLPLREPRVTVKGLEPNTDYRFTVRRARGEGSHTRLVRTGDYEGDAVINYLHPEDNTYAFSGNYLASPSITKLPSGNLLAAMDVFRAQGGQNLSLLFLSEDGGASWQYLNELYPCFWPKPFVWNGKLYLTATATEYGDLLIGCSEDEGKTWSKPVSLLPGTYGRFGPHKAPVPFVEHAGRIWTSVEYGSWSSGHHDMSVMSFRTTDDPMRPENWLISDYVMYDGNWKGAPSDSGYGKKSAGGGIEGNVMVAPDGGLAVYYRIDIMASSPNFGKSLVMRADPSNPEKPLAFDRFPDCPVGCNAKFFMQRDPLLGKYIAIGTEQSADKPLRTVLSMAVSDDMYRWKTVLTLYDRRRDDPRAVGFQYPDWCFDGDDILLVTRTATNGADNFHDSNHISFRRIVRFRQYC